MNTSSIFTSSRLRSLRESFEPVLKAMKGGAAAVAPGGAPGAPPDNVPIGQQLIETFVITLVFSITMQILESNFAQIKRYQSMAVELFPLTYDSPQTFPQDPDSGFPILEPSKDERNGTEFSYSCFLSVQPETFTGEKNAFKHVYHKGSVNVFPLMAPGVFFKADKNTLRVYMNSSMEWGNFIDVHNIPMKKWFHLVVMVKGRALDVYINGNLANRHKFRDIPKLNFGGFYLFLPKNVNTQIIKEKQQCTPEKAAGSATSQITKETEKNLKGVPITILGRMNGYASRIKYYAFALSFSQIDKLLREGPNPTMFRPSATAPTDPSQTVAVGWDTKNNSGPLYVPNSNAFDKNLPGYQTDAWWTSGNAYPGNGNPHESGEGPN
jgi:hypothetical protein